ncbi:MAG: response regulator transcription factor [Acidimicrobiia bacterium]|nr:response regulator transcription factor [Acidimicrobiia bacterium]
MIRIGIVDDQELVRTGFRMILDSEDDFEVVGEAADGESSLAMVRARRPDVVLMDVRMPVMDGVEATRQLATSPDTKVIIVTTFDLDEYVFAALRHGASGFLLKDAPADQLVSAIRVVASGEALLAPSITRRLIEQFQASGPPPATSDGEQLLASLTERESEVLAELARGLSNAEIAEKLFVSETTVKTHVGRVLTKLNVRDRVQAVVMAYESGVVRPGSG